MTAPASSWGVRPWLRVLGLAVVAAGVVLLLLAGTSRDHLVGGAAVVAGVVVTLWGWRFRERLTADATGLTVRRLVGADRIPWSRVVTVTARAHRRLGTQNSLLEVDLDDDGLLVFSSTELGAPIDDVTAQLHSWRQGRPPPPPAAHV